MHSNNHSSQKRSRVGCDPWLISVNHNLTSRWVCARASLQAMRAVRRCVRGACVRECVCLRLPAAGRGEVLSCCCFLRADTGVNIQQMMSRPRPGGGARWGEGQEGGAESLARFPHRPVNHHNNLLSYWARVRGGMF